MNRGKPPEQHLGELLTLGDHCSEREQRATNAERELNKVKLLNYLEDKVGTKFEGVVTGVENFGLFVTGKELPAEGFVHITSLSDDYYKFDKAGHVIKGFRSGNTYRLGDQVTVAVASVDVERRELDFRLLSKQGGAKAERKSKRKTGEAHEQAWAEETALISKSNLRPDKLLPDGRFENSPAIHRWVRLSQNLVSPGKDDKIFKFSIISAGTRSCV